MYPDCHTFCRERREGQRVFEEKMRKLEEQFARAASEEAANGRERERLQAEWRELGERKRASTGVSFLSSETSTWLRASVDIHFGSRAVSCGLRANRMASIVTLR